MPAYLNPNVEPPALYQNVDNTGGGMTSATPAPPRNPDPWQPANRGSYHVSHFLDRHLLRPLSVAYRSWLPHPIRNGIHNILSNLAEPNIFINDALQLHPISAAHSGGRFLINSTLGVVGIFDVAEHIGIHDHDNDFGLTLGRYGVGSGPYLYIPVVGPSNLRDATGAVVDFFLDPIPPSSIHNPDTFTATQTTLDALDTRVSIDQSLKTLEATSIDPYASIRTIYIQYRAAALNHGHAVLEDMPDMPDDTAPSPSETPPNDAAPPPPSTAPSMAPNTPQ